MPMLRYQIRNEYGLSDPELYGAAEKNDPEALLEGVAMAGLVGLLRQLGDLAEFAAEIFHDLHEEVMATASRGHGLTLRLQQLEAEFPSVEKDLISQISLPNVTQNEGIEWRTNVQIDQNLVTRGDMPRFVMDSYEECNGPPRLFTLDKFDVAGAGACLKRYSDPSFFKTEFASSGTIETEDARREKKPRKIKKKATRWKKGETLESLLISSSESPSSSEKLFAGKALISRVIKLKSRRLPNSANNTRKIYHVHLLELIESQQNILEDSRRQSNIKLESSSISKQAPVQISFEIENEAQKMHKIFPIQEQNEASSESEKIEIGIEISSLKQAKEKTMADSDDMASEHENFVDAFNTIELEMEKDSENKPKSVSVSSSQEEMVCGNLGSDSVKELVGSDKVLELNGETEIGETTEEFFDNDDLMDVSSTSSLHSDGAHPTEQPPISHGNDLKDESKVPAGDNENELGALEKTSTVDEAGLDVEDLVCLPSQSDNHPEQTNSHLTNINVPISDAFPETSEIPGVDSNSQEIKFLEETPIVEDSLGSHEGDKYMIDNRSSTSLEEFEEPLKNPIEVSQVELRNISEEIQNLEEFLISTRKEENISQDIISHGGEDARNHAITAEHLDVHTEDTTQDFAEEKFEDPNERLQYEQSDKSGDVLNGDSSVFSNGEEELAPGSATSLPTEVATELTTHTEGLHLEETLRELGMQPNKDPTTITSDDSMDNSKSSSIQELEASSSGPHSSINIPEETTIQGSYPKYHMDNSLEPNESLVHLGETRVETYRNESPHHFEAETQTKQFNESEDWQQYLDKDESTVALINYEPAVESLQANCENNSSSKLDKLPINGDDSFEVCADNPFSRDIYVGSDGMCANKSALFSTNDEYQMWAGDFEAGAKEEGPCPAVFLREPTGSPCEIGIVPEFGTKPQVVTSSGQKDALLQTEVALDFPDSSLHYEVDDHQVPEQDLEMEPRYLCDANEVYRACEETLPVVEDGFAHADVAANSVEVHELLQEDLETKSQEIFEEGVVNNEVLVETSKLNEEGNGEGGVPIPFELENEILVEALKFNEKDNAEGGVPTSSVVNNEVVAETFMLIDEDNPEGGIPIPSVDHVHELLQKETKTENEVSVESINEKEEVSANTGSPTPSVDHVHEILQEPTNLNCHEPDTPPNRILHEECHLEYVGYAHSVFTTEEGNITQSCTISLNNPFYDAGPSENLSQEPNELYPNKPVPCTSLDDDQEKLQVDINRIAADFSHNNSTSEPCTLDPNKTVLAESCLHSSSFDQDLKVSQESFDSKPVNILGGDMNIESDEVLANNALANVSSDTEAGELDMCTAYSLASEHKPPPLPPLGWRMGGRLGKGTSLSSNGHSFKPVYEMNQNPSVQMGSMEAPPKANHDDLQRVEGEKPQLVSLSDLPPISCQHQLANPNSTLVPSSGTNVEYDNGSGTALGLPGPEMRAPQYAWPDSQHPFLPVPAWTTGPGLVQMHQPGYLISLEDNLWAQYGIRPSIEDEVLGRKHCSIRNMPRNPLIDAVAAHDRSTMRKVAELVKPDDKAKADERNSLLEQIRNKSFSLRPVGAPKTKAVTAVNVPQTNLKVAAIVEKANAIRQAFAGSDEEDGDSWSDA